MKQRIDSFRTSSGKVSGPAVVFTLFSGALLLFGIVFFVAYRQKITDQSAMNAGGTTLKFESAVTVDSIRSWMAKIPADWVKVTAVEGQGFVLFVPCYSANPLLSFRSAPDSLPRLLCENCDSVSEYAIKAIQRNPAVGTLEFQLEPMLGNLRIIPVNDSLMAAYPDAPFRDKLLQWTRIQPDGKSDTLLFISQEQASEFETLRAEDENPEGCGTQSED